MGKEVNKFEVPISEITSILDWIHKSVWQISKNLGGKTDYIIVSVPDYFIDIIIYQNEQMTTMIVNKDKYTLFGCKIQPSYENKITVFNKHRFYTKEDYLQLQLNTAIGE